MPIDLIFDSLAVRLNGPKADGKTIASNWDFTDIDEQWVLGLEHGALHHHRGHAPHADPTLRLTKDVFVEILTGRTDMITAVSPGRAAIEGDPTGAAELFSLLDTPDHHFNVVTP